VAFSSYLDLQIGVEQNFEIKCLFALVTHIEYCLQVVGTQRNTVHETKVERPCLPDIVWEGRAIEAKIKLDTAICVVLGGRCLGGGFVQKLPTSRAGEAVLRERGRSMVGWWLAKYLFSTISWRHAMAAAK
jgi:hypothetical protein